MFRYSAALAALVAIFGGAAAASTITPFGLTLGDNGRTLVTIDDLSRPGEVRGTSISDGRNALALDAIAFRPQTREVLGYGASTGTAYTLDVRSGVATPLASTADRIRVSEIGFNFNPTIDAARLVSTADDNQVVFPNNAPPDIQRFTDLFYGDGDRNAGANPAVFANAYTNAVPNASASQQYVLDARTDSLATLGNNLGTLETVGAIRVDGAAIDFTVTGGFDIFSTTEGDNTAYALLTTASGQGLYLLDLLPDADGFVNASLVGRTDDAFGPLGSLAVAPVPLPAGIWLMLAGIGSIAVMRRRRMAAG